jgi:pilus assembly protein TadC
MIAFAVVAAALAAAIVVRPRDGHRRRLARLIPTRDLVAQVRSQQSRSPARLAIAAAVLVTAIAIDGGVAGVAIGLLAATAVATVRPRRPVVTVRADEVPVVVDLLAGCLDAGAPMVDAVETAAVAAGPELQVHCKAVAAALRSGVPPAEAWVGWLGDPWLAPVARTAVRTAHTGAAAAADLRRTAARLRARHRCAAQERLRRASIWLVVPLGLCFLPAFVLVSVVPLVAGLLPSLH